MRLNRLLLPLVLALALLAAACSSDDDAESTDAGSDETTETDDATESDEAGEDESSDDATEDESSDDDAMEDDAMEDDAMEDESDDAMEDDAMEDESSEDDAMEEESDEAAAGAIAVGLGEWFIDTPATLEAGSLTFAVENTGENPHALAVVKGTSYEDLPLKDNGAVDIDAVGDDFLGTTENLQSGESGEITFELEAGDYVFFCPIEFGPNSHAAAGQVLSVTVG